MIKIEPRLLKKALKNINNMNEVEDGVFFDMNDNELIMKKIKNNTKTEFKFKALVYHNPKYFENI